MTRVARPLLYLGMAVAVAGLSKLHASELGTYDYTGSSRFGWSLAFVAVLAAVAYAVGLPDVPRSRRSALASVFLAAAGAAALMSVVQLVVGEALLPRFVVLGAPLALAPWYLVCINLALDGRAADADRDRVLLVADPSEQAYLRDELAQGSEVPARLVRCLTTAQAARDGSGRSPLMQAAVASGATVLVLDRDAQEQASVVAQAAELHMEGMRVRTLSLFYEQWLAKLPVSELERVSMMFDIGELHRQRYARLSRLFDLVLGAAGAVVLVAAIPFVALGNAVANRGPLFFRQQRIGREGRPFTILKFRTMRTDGASSAMGTTEWTTEDDPRITRFGGLLRTSHLDELPQVVNIVRGDLAVVGPRPEQERYVAELSEKLPFYAMRHLVRPGLTGWAQVKYGYAGDERDALEKLQYEFFYLRRQSLVLDLRIVVRTVRSVLGREGR